MSNGLCKHDHCHAKNENLNEQVYKRNTNAHQRAELDDIGLTEDVCDILS